MNEDTFDGGVCPGAHEGLSDLCKWEFQGKRSRFAPAHVLHLSKTHFTQLSMNLYVTVTDDRLN